MTKTKIIGLTGQTGAGKTLVCDMLTGRGFRVINCDEVARKVVEKGSRCLMDLTIEFGMGILNADSTLNRKALGEIVFSDRARKKRMEQIIFPHITEEIFAMVERLRESGEPAVFLDAPTLIESGIDKSCDKVVSVIAPPEDRFLRIVRRDRLSTEEAGRRMSAQQDDSFYTSASDFVIENGGEMAELTIKILEMLDAVGLSLPGEKG